MPTNETKHAGVLCQSMRHGLFALGFMLASAGISPVGAEEPGSWKSRAALPGPRFEMASAAAAGRLYVFGGFAPGTAASRETYSYDPASDRWQRHADMPQALTHVNTASDGQSIWLAGGFENTGRGPAVANVWRYDVATDTWTAGTALPEPRAGGGLAAVDGRLHYFGGLLADRDTDSPAHWTLALERGSGWQEAPPMPAPRNQFGVVVVGSRIFAVGGQFHHDSTMAAPQDQTRVDVYDTSSRTWSRAPDLPVPLSHTEPGTFVHASRIVVVGGRGTGGHLAGVWTLPIAETEWERISSIPAPRLAPAARVLDGRLIVAGGASDGLVPQAEVWDLELATQWTP